MRAEPLKGLLMQQLMPVLAKALVEATEEQAADPVQFVAHKLLQVMFVVHVKRHTGQDIGAKTWVARKYVGSWLKELKVSCQSMSHTMCCWTIVLAKS